MTNPITAQRPDRPPTFYADVLARFSNLCTHVGLTQAETVAVGIQFVALAIATNEVPEAQQPQLETAIEALCQTHNARVAARGLRDLAAHR